MSGHKRTTITLSRDELRRLQEASRRLSEVDLDFQKIQAQIAQLRSQNLNQTYQEFENRQQAFNHSLDGMTAHLASIEYSTSQAMVRQAASLQDEISRMGTDVWENTYALLTEHTQQMEDAFAESQSARHTQFQQLHRSLSQIRQSEQEKAAYVYQAIEEARILFESISDLYGREETIQPELQNTSRMINQAIENVNTGFCEAALLSAQQTMDLLTHARIQMENQIQQRQVLRQIAQDRLLKLKETLRANRKVRAVNIQGEPLEGVIDVDFWSNEAWRTIVKRYRRLEEQLTSEKNIELESIRHMIDELDQIEIEIPQIIFNARLAVISSQVRFNIAESVVAALQEQGYALETSSYEHNDMRCSYSIQLGNFEGSHVEVHLTPHPHDPIAHNLDVDFVDPDLRSAHEMRQRAGELSTSLHAYGLQLNDLKELTENRAGMDQPARRTAQRVQEKKQHYGNH